MRKAERSCEFNVLKFSQLVSGVHALLYVGNAPLFVETMVANHNGAVTKLIVLHRDTLINPTNNESQQKGFS